MDRPEWATVSVTAYVAAALSFDLAVLDESSRGIIVHLFEVIPVRAADANSEVSLAHRKNPKTQLPLDSGSAPAADPDEDHKLI